MEGALFPLHSALVYCQRTRCRINRILRRGLLFYEPKHFKAWLRPMIVWTSFTLILLFMLHCINTLVRRQWVHTERLAFPIIQLPVAMTQSPNFFAEWSVVGRILYPFILDLTNGLHVLFPSVPYLHLKLHFIGRQLTEKPWDAMSNTMISFYPFMIGLGFFCH